MGDTIVIGGGIIGLSAAFYLQRSGHRVTVLDKGDFLNNCSYGNCGYVCPSHFIPLASPGIVKQGLKWMMNPGSPFYIQPRLNRSLLNWGWNFIQRANKKNAEFAAIPLRDIAEFSQREYESWMQIPGFDFSYERKGLLEIFQTAANAEHALHTVEKGKELGLDVSLLSQSELQAKEPHTPINGMGAIYFGCDAHLYPEKLMHGLINYLKNQGVQLLAGEEVKGIETRGNSITRLITGNQVFEPGEIVLAAGSWSRELARIMGAKIPLVPGRGYSLTLENSPYRLNHPAILVEGRAAITPMDGNKIRFGGTMEIVSTATPPRYERMQSILDAVRRFFPEFDVPMPAPEKIWYGYRPCSADGLPYIGRIKKYRNLVLATGHSMLGLSLGAGTGRLVAELINGGPVSLDLTPFKPERFG